MSIDTFLKQEFDCTDSSVVHSFLEHCRTVIESIEFDVREGCHENLDASVEDVIVSDLTGEADLLLEYLPHFKEAIQGARRC